MNKEIMKKIKIKKPVLVTAIALAAAIGLSVTAYAWFTNQRMIATITRINAPTSLSIGAGAKEDAVYIDMGGIDVEKGRSKSFVFCVFSDDTLGDYKVQLAHTTNIGFEYTIYKSTESGTANSFDVLYTDSGNENHYYVKGEVLGGRYLNKDVVSGIANDSLHDKSYGTYENVQKNAEALYWQSDVIQPTQSGVMGFVDYYILEVSWDSQVKNDKETDMVYIMAGLS